MYMDEAGNAVKLLANHFNFMFSDMLWVFPDVAAFMSTAIASEARILFF